MLESESASNRISTGTRITIRIYPLNHRASATIGIYIRIPERVARNSKQVLGTHIDTGALDEFATGTRYIVGQFEVFQSDEAAVINKPVGHFIGSLVEIGIFCGRILGGPVIVVHLAQRIPVISIILSLCSHTKRIYIITY